MAKLKKPESTSSIMFNMKSTTVSGNEPKALCENENEKFSHQSDSISNDLSQEEQVRLGVYQLKNIFKSNNKPL